MKQSLITGKVAFLGNYPPRQCGIATFTRDLREAVLSARPEWSCPVVAITDPHRSYDYPEDVRFELLESDARGYLRAADFLNMSLANALCVQHEFGIYGGPVGSHVISLLKRVHMPVVTTLHTVLSEPSSEQRKVFTELAALSNRLIVMTARGETILRETWGIPTEKIEVIPHGIPDIPFADPNFYKDQLGVMGRHVILTFGLLSPGKGIEYGIRALPRIVESHPEAVYVILGATHPNLLRADGETYRLSLERLAKRLGVERNVMFVNRYVDARDLSAFIGAADVYLTPYLNENQITSGTLAYCFGAGKAVVSTPYWHAAELLADGRGELVPFRDADAIAEAINGLFADNPRRHRMRKDAYLMGREMIWSQVGHAYALAFESALSDHRAASTSPVRSPATLASDQSDLPLWRFDHLLRMSDSTGIFQHAIHSVPWFEHGYCVDDNARALLFTILLEDLEDELPPELAPLQSAAAALLQHAFSPESGRFRNFLSFDRRWLEATGSDDCHGRALWALGATVGRTRNNGLRAWAAGLFEIALPPLEALTSPRAWAFAILGLHEYLRVFNGDLLADRWRHELAGRLKALFQKNAGPGWPWLEDIVSYDNARIPHALILHGRWAECPEMLQTGLDALRWLQTAQTGTDGFFRPIGSNGFWKRGEEPAVFDQQPLEAAASVSACIEAYNATSDPWWRAEATRAFEWYLGSNDLNLALFDASNGGCFDGLNANRANQNQGAESTLSFLLALVEMKALHNHLLSFSAPKDQPEK